MSNNCKTTRMDKVTEESGQKLTSILMRPTTKEKVICPRRSSRIQRKPVVKLVPANVIKRDFVSKVSEGQPQVTNFAVKTSKGLSIIPYHSSINTPVTPKLVHVVTPSIKAKSSVLQFNQSLLNTGQQMDPNKKPQQIHRIVKPFDERLNTPRTTATTTATCSYPSSCNASVQFRSSNSLQSSTNLQEDTGSSTKHGKNISSKTVSFPQRKMVTVLKPAYSPQDSTDSRHSKKVSVDVPPVVSSSRSDQLVLVNKGNISVISKLPQGTLILPHSSCRTESVKLPEPIRVMTHTKVNKQTSPQVQQASDIFSKVQKIAVKQKSLLKVPPNGNANSSDQYAQVTYKEVQNHLTLGKQATQKYATSEFLPTSGSVPIVGHRIPLSDNCKIIMRPSRGKFSSSTDGNKLSLVLRRTVPQLSTPSCMAATGGLVYTSPASGCTTQMSTAPLISPLHHHFEPKSADIVDMNSRHPELGLKIDSVFTLNKLSTNDLKIDSVRSLKDETESYHETEPNIGCDMGLQIQDCFTISEDVFKANDFVSHENECRGDSLQVAIAEMAASQMAELSQRNTDDDQMKAASDTMYIVEEDMASHPMDTDVSDDFHLEIGFPYSAEEPFSGESTYKQKTSRRKKTLPCKIHDTKRSLFEDQDKDSEQVKGKFWDEEDHEDNSSSDVSTKNKENVAKKAKYNISIEGLDAYNKSTPEEVVPYNDTEVDADKSVGLLDSENILKNDSDSNRDESNTREVLCSETVDSLDEKEELSDVSTKNRSEAESDIHVVEPIDIPYSDTCDDDFSTELGEIFQEARQLLEKFVNKRKQLFPERYSPTGSVFGEKSDELVQKPAEPQLPGNLCSSMKVNIPELKKTKYGIQAPIQVCGKLTKKYGTMDAREYDPAATESLNLGKSEVDNQHQSITRIRVIKVPAGGVSQLDQPTKIQIAAVKSSMQTAQSGASSTEPAKNTKGFVRIVKDGKVQLLPVIITRGPKGMVLTPTVGDSSGQFGSQLGLNIYANMPKFGPDLNSKTTSRVSKEAIRDALDKTVLSDIQDFENVMESSYQESNVAIEPLSVGVQPIFQTPHEAVFDYIPWTKVDERIARAMHGCKDCSVRIDKLTITGGRVNLSKVLQAELYFGMGYLSESPSESEQSDDDNVKEASDNLTCLTGGKAGLVCDGGDNEWAFDDNNSVCSEVDHNFVISDQSDEDNPYCSKDPRSNEGINKQTQKTDLKRERILESSDNLSMPVSENCQSNDEQTWNGENVDQTSKYCPYGVAPIVIAPISGYESEEYDDISENLTNPVWNLEESGQFPYMNENVVGEINVNTDNNDEHELVTEDECVSYSDTESENDDSNAVTTSLLLPQEETKNNKKDIQFPSDGTSAYEFRHISFFHTYAKSPAFDTWRKNGGKDSVVSQLQIVKPKKGTCMTVTPQNKTTVSSTPIPPSSISTRSSARSKCALTKRDKTTASLTNAAPSSSSKQASVSGENKATAPLTGVPPVIPSTPSLSRSKCGPPQMVSLLKQHHTSVVKLKSTVVNTEKVTPVGLPYSLQTSEPRKIVYKIPKSASVSSRMEKDSLNDSQTVANIHTEREMSSGTNRKRKSSTDETDQLTIKKEKTEVSKNDRIENLKKMLKAQEEQLEKIRKERENTRSLLSLYENDI